MSSLSSALMEMWDIYYFKSTWEIPFILIIFAGSIIRKKRNVSSGMAYIGLTIVILVWLNPVLYLVLKKIASYDLYNRCLWMIPLDIMAAFGIVAVCNRIASKKKKVLFMLLLCAFIVFCHRKPTPYGDLDTIPEAYRTDYGSLYHTWGETREICEAIHKDMHYEQKRVVTTSAIAHGLCQYDWELELQETGNYQPVQMLDIMNRIGAKYTVIQKTSPDMIIIDIPELLCIKELDTCNVYVVVSKE